jgi:hypothetical protein
VGQDTLLAQCSITTILVGTHHGGDLTMGETSDLIELQVINIKEIIHYI